MIPAAKPELTLRQQKISELVQNCIPRFRAMSRLRRPVTGAVGKINLASIFDRGRK
jgi:hypothetical protein